jgi:hypothetical protein
VGLSAYEERLAGIAERFERVMLRNGWRRLPVGKRPWYRP